MRASFSTRGALSKAGCCSAMARSSLPSSKSANVEGRGPGSAASGAAALEPAAEAAAADELAAEAAAQLRCWTAGGWYSPPPRSTQTGGGSVTQRLGSTPGKYLLCQAEYCTTRAKRQRPMRLGGSKRALTAPSCCALQRAMAL